MDTSHTLPDGQAPIVMRGEYMNRIETFVAAAFAFAVTMLVISLDAIPQTFEELVMACKQIPAFAASFALVTWIWHSHANWSRWFGLQDTPAILLSSMLVFIVLVYVYPLRIMMSGLFASLSGGFFPNTMQFTAYWEVRFMFAFYAFGLFTLCMNFVGLYGYALKKQHALNLSALEIYDARTHIYNWLATSSVCVVSFVMAVTLPTNMLGLAGFINFILFPILTILGVKRRNLRTVEFGDVPHEPA